MLFQFPLIVLPSLRMLKRRSHIQTHLKTKVKITIQLNPLLRIKESGQEDGSGFILLCTCIKVTSLMLYVLKCVHVSLCETAGFVLVVPAAYRAGETPGEY